MAAATGMLAPDPASLRGEALAQAGTQITIEMGKAKGLSPQDIHDRGSRLRADLDKAFDALEVGAKAGHADEFTAIVHPYISAGMTLEDAVAILSAAGFSAPPAPRARDGQDRNSATERYAIVAEIPQFSGRVFGSVEAYVMLLAPEQSPAEFVGRRHRMVYEAGEVAGRALAPEPVLDESSYFVLV